MQAIIRSNEINNYQSVQDFFYKIADLGSQREGYLYYKYPMSATSYDEIPDIVIADKEYGVSVIIFYEWYERDID